MLPARNAPANGATTRRTGSDMAARFAVLFENMALTILIVDDEPKITHGLQNYLRQAGYLTLVAFDGQTALDVAHREQPDLVLLDLLLPRVDGRDVCRRLRRASAVPIIMLTALGEERDMIEGLALGADDYIAKPFSPRAVVARVQAVLRRTRGAMEPRAMIERAGVHIDLDRWIVTISGRDVRNLTPAEYELLVTLIRQPGRPFSRAQLLQMLLSVAEEGDERTIDAHIKNLRRKIEPDPAYPRYILTVFKIGYRFADDVPGE